MYAIIRAGGKQSKVREGDVIDVERLRVTEGTVAFIPLLVVGEDGTVISDRTALGNATVTAEVLGEHRGDKIEVFKYKPKTGYRRHQGHRQTYTTLRVTSIGTGSDGAAKPKKRAAAAKDEDRAAKDNDGSVTADTPVADTDAASEEG